MANVAKVVPPTQPTYLVELTQDEIDIITGIASDLIDLRNVYMVYPIDGDTVRPTEKASKVLDGLVKGLGGTQGVDYDYFDYWEEIPQDELETASDVSAKRW